MVCLFQTSQSKAKGEKGVLDVLKQMAAVRVTPNVDTIHQHVLPHLAVGDGIKGLLKKLRAADVPSTVVANSLLLQSLDRRDFSSATQIAQSFEYKSLSIQQCVGKFINNIHFFAGFGLITI